MRDAYAANKAFQHSPQIVYPYLYLPREALAQIAKIVFFDCVNTAEFDKLIKRLKEDKSLHAFYIYGDDTYLKDEIIRSVLSMAEGSMSAFNRALFHSDELKDIKPLTDILMEYPMMADLRVVVLVGMNRLAQSVREKLLELTIPETSFLLLVGDAPTGRPKWQTAIKKKFPFAIANTPPPQEIGEWVVRFAKELGLKLDSGAARFLAESVNTDLVALRNEIAKLSLWADGAVVDIAVVKRLISQSRVRERYGLTNAFQKRSKSRFIHYVRELIHYGEQLPLIIGRLASETANIAMAKSGKLPSKMHPYRKQLYQTYGRAFSDEELAAIIETLYDADIMVKRGVFKPETSLVFMVGSIVSHWR